jgi:hypothetical protein
MVDAQWGRLQASFLATLADQGPFDIKNGTMVVVPSLTLPADELKDVAGIQFYEERLLFLLLLLSRPDVRLVFISSSEIASEIIDYYLDFLSCRDRLSIRERLTLVPVGDIRQLPLTTKMLQHQEVIAFVRHIIRRYRDAYLLPFNVTKQEEELAGRLGIPIYGMPSGAAHLGEKIGGRLVAHTAGVPVVQGAEDIRTAQDIQRTFTQICHRDGDRHHQSPIG